MGPTTILQAQLTRMNEIRKQKIYAISDKIIDTWMRINQFGIFIRR